MAITPIDDRRFTDAEVREILKRAAKATPSRSLIKREGVSLAELKAIGAEVGIAPAHLEEAARVVAQQRGDRSKGFLGGPMVLNVERRVAGEFDPSDMPEVLAIIRRTMGRQGEAAEIHGSLEWRAAGDAGERHVSISSKDGVTTIRGAANLTNTAALTYLPATALGSIATFGGLSQGLIPFLAILPILYPILRGIMGKVSRAESAKLERLVDELAQLVARSDDE